MGLADQTIWRDLLYSLFALLSFHLFIYFSFEGPLFYLQLKSLYCLNVICQLDLSVQKNGFRKCGYSSETNGTWNQKTEKHFKFILDIVLLYCQLCSQQHKSVWTYCRCNSILKYGLQKSKCGQAILHDFGFLCMLSSCCSLL